MIKALSQLGMEWMFPNPIKAIYDKPAPWRMGEKWEARIRQGYPLLSLPFMIVLEVLARASKQEQEIKGIQTGEEEVKWSLFASDMLLFNGKQRLH